MASLMDDLADVLLQEDKDNDGWKYCQHHSCHCVMPLRIELTYECISGKHQRLGLV